MSAYLFLDTETTGLDVDRHHVWEIAYAIDDEPVQSSFVTHSLVAAQDVALEVGNYWQRMAQEPFSAHEGAIWEGETQRRLGNYEDDLYLVGANPAFDQRFLERRWGSTPWHYRTVDIETFAMGALGPLLDSEVWLPKGLYATCETLNNLGWDVPLPDHSAAGDVEAVRKAFTALTAIYKGEGA